MAIVAHGGPGYPERLTDLEDPPPVIFALGNRDLLNNPAVAIVGTREATLYGLRITAMLASGAAAAGLTVVSGLARGVDAEAHRTALPHVGSTIAVLGTGADVPYPMLNHALHRRIEDSGLVVSEALPGARPHPGAFPRRNRLIAALADVVVVTEAGDRSGALITAGVAVALGRMHAAVPGPVDVASASGSNRLLRDGAQVVTSVEDMLGLVYLTPRGRRKRETAPAPSHNALTQELGDDEMRVLTVLRQGPRLPDELIAGTGLSPSALVTTLATLEILGQVVLDPDGVVRMAVPVVGPMVKAQ